MGQTAEHIRDNIVKITDENGNFKGTDFFIHKEYCATYHHNIWQLDEIYVERGEQEDNMKEDSREKENTLQNGLKNFQTCKKT